MNKSIRKLLATIFLFAFLISLSTVFAMQPTIDKPNWSYIENANCQCSVKGGTVTADAYVQGNDHVTKCQITLSIQKRVGSSWVTVDSDIDSDNSSYLEMELTTPAEAGVTYRAKASVKVWFSSGTENTTITSN